MSLRPLRLLVLDDSADDAELLLREIQRGDYQVRHELVQTASAMHEALSRGPWDVILSDYSMPGFTAPDALNVLKSSGHDIPFIIVSGTIGEDTAVHALQSGADDFLVKGRLARLLPAVSRVLQESS